MSFRIEGYILDTNGYDKVELIECAVGIDIEKEPQRSGLPFFDKEPSPIENTVKMYSALGKIIVYNSKSARVKASGYNKHQLLEELTDFYKTRCLAFNYYADKDEITYILYEQGKRVNRWEYKIKSGSLIEPENPPVQIRVKEITDLFREVHMPVIRDLMNFGKLDFEKLTGYEYLKIDSDDIIAGEHWLFHKGYTQPFRELSSHILKNQREGGLNFSSFFENEAVRARIDALEKYEPLCRTNHVLLHTNPAGFSDERLALDFYAIEWVTRSENINPIYQFWKLLLYAEMQHRYGEKDQIGDNYLDALESASLFEELRKKRHQEFLHAFKNGNKTELRNIDPESFVRTYLKRPVHQVLSNEDTLSSIRFFDSELKLIEQEGQIVPEFNEWLLSSASYDSNEVSREINDLKKLRLGYASRRLPFHFESRLAILEWNLEFRKQRPRQTPKRSKPSIPGEKPLQFRNWLAIALAIALLIALLYGIL